MIQGKIIIAGAGIGGLCLAHALKRAGMSVVVAERAAALEPAGACITVQCNAVAALREIGLDQAVLAAGQPIAQASVRDARGRVLTSTPPGFFEREFGVPSVAIHRAELLSLLAGAVGQDSIQMGFSVVRYEQDREKVVAHADDGRSIEGSILVGADGLWSRVRSHLVADGPPRYAGYTSWRGVCEAPGLLPDGYTSESWGRGQRLGLVSLGRGRIYWFATANAPAGEKDPHDAVVALSERFLGWHAPIEEVLLATPEERMIRTDIHDRTPIVRWSDGRVVLLGDAAHPMTPNLGQGGCQAIEDAVVLARALTRHDGVAAAFHDYEAVRVRRANDVVRRSRSLGDIGQLNGSVVRFLRDTAMRLTPESVVKKQMKSVMKFSVG
jgi:2-polyprenyl-6-methoxyphenol hydroxylase-like FAD-dependent oxidoreductase